MRTFHAKKVAATYKRVGMNNAYLGPRQSSVAVTFFMTVSGERLSDQSAYYFMELQHGIPKQKRCNPQAQA